jgi:hypothetical protein
MSPIKTNKTPSPLASEYIFQKKLVSQNNKTVSVQKTPKSSILSGDAVTLSADQLEDQNVPSRLFSSQPVTFEEKGSLNSTYSITA